MVKMSVHKTHSPCLMTRKDTVVVVQFRFGEENTANLRDLWQLFCSHGVGCWLSQSSQSLACSGYKRVALLPSTVINGMV